MEKDKTFQSLQRIKKVAAPPFLYTRIEQKIKNLQTPKVAWSWVLSGSLSFCLLVYFNISLVHSSLNTGASANDLELLIEDINRVSSNQLYYE
ncbi:MAG: hypothetical protein ACI8P3_003806 [Saprospiraceae bacterium]|jgi:hypothetical protein